MSPFRIFVSSPVDGIKDFRDAVIETSAFARRKGRFEFFFFEEHDNVRIPGKTICESIFVTSGLTFDALFVFFKDRIGNGTKEELDFFETTVIPANPRCDVWWSQIDCDCYPQDVGDFIARLQAYNTGLPTAQGLPKNCTPANLTNRLAAKLLDVSEPPL